MLVAVVSENLVVLRRSEVVVLEWTDAVVVVGSMIVVESTCVVVG